MPLFICCVQEGCSRCGKMCKRPRVNKGIGTNHSGFPGTSLMVEKVMVQAVGTVLSPALHLFRCDVLLSCLVLQKQTDLLHLVSLGIKSFTENIAQQ